MKHTLKAKYAADGLTAHRQRMTATPEGARIAKAAQDQAKLDQITARLKAKPGAPDEDYRSMAKASLANFFSGVFDKAVYARLAAMKAKPLQFNTIRRPAQYQLKGRSADTIILDDIVHDDMTDAAVFSMKHLSAMAPASPNWTLGVDIARPGRDFGVIQVNATC